MAVGCNALADTDAELLAICAGMEARRQEWLRLWDATPEDGERTPADEAFDAYGSTMWPNCPDLVARLIATPAATLAGLGAKAAAALAIRDNGFHEAPDNGWELTSAVLREVSALAPAAAAHHPAPIVSAATAA